MMRNRTDDKLFCEIASLHSLDSSEVRKIVMSFFDAVEQEAKQLPFNTERKIYAQDKFQSYVSVTPIPHVGRIGPVYSRYLKWRANEAATNVQFQSRSSFRRGLTQDDIEHIAEQILSGASPVINKKKNSEMFDRVWLVGTSGKKQARQVIPKDK